MSENFEMVKQYLNDMDLAIVEEDPAEELVVVEIGRASCRERVYTKV